MSDGTVQAGNGRRVQARKPLPNAFTDERKQVFLDHLAGCANIAQAAAAAGVKEGTIYNHRRRNPVFAAHCADALEAGYETLEAAMVERAAHGYRRGPNADAAPGPDGVDTALGLHLLSIRKAKGACRTGRPPLQRATDKELNDAICAKLAVLDRRIKAGRPLGFRGRKETRMKGSEA